MTSSTASSPNWWAKLTIGGVLGSIVGYLFRANITDWLRNSYEHTDSSSWFGSAAGGFFNFFNKYHVSSIAHNSWNHYVTYMIPAFTALIGALASYLPQMVSSIYSSVRSNRFLKNGEVTLNHEGKKLQCQTVITSEDAKPMLLCKEVGPDSAASFPSTDGALVPFAPAVPAVVFSQGAVVGKGANSSCVHENDAKNTQAMVVDLASKMPEGGAVLVKMAVRNQAPNGTTCTHETMLDIRKSTSTSVSNIRDSIQLSADTPVPAQLPLIEELSDDDTPPISANSVQERRLVVRPS